MVTRKKVSKIGKNGVSMQESPKGNEGKEKSPIVPPRRGEFENFPRIYGKSHYQRYQTAFGGCNRRFLGNKGRFFFITYPVFHYLFDKVITFFTLNSRKWT